MVRGNVLVEVLSELLTELASETHPTPAVHLAHQLMHQTTML